MCEQSLKEEELQSHLFETHSAENLQVQEEAADRLPLVSPPVVISASQDYFVRVCPDKPRPASKERPRYLYI